MNNEKMIERALKKLDQIDERISSIDKTLERNTASLEVHIRRTEIAEDAIKDLRTDLKPVESHVSLMNGIFKAMSALGIITGLVIGAIKLFK